MKFTFGIAITFGLIGLAHSQSNTATVVKSAVTADTIDLPLVHHVKKGETLYKIAKEYKMSLAQIQALNPNVTALSPGMALNVVKKTIHLPEKKVEVPTQNLSTHTVEKGETLYNIAKKYNTSVDILRKINNFGESNISIGQVIQVPVVNPLLGQPENQSPRTDKTDKKEPAEKEAPVKSDAKGTVLTNSASSKTTMPEPSNAVKTTNKSEPVAIKSPAKDAGGMPEKTTQTMGALKENEIKGVLSLESELFNDPSADQRSWVLFDGAAEGDVVAVTNTKNNIVHYCIVKGKNKNSNSVIGASKFVTEKLGIFDEKTVVIVKYVTGKK